MTLQRAVVLCDSGANSLRDRLAVAAPNDTMVFAPGLTRSILVLSTLTVTPRSPRTRDLRGRPSRRTTRTSSSTTVYGFHRRMAVARP